MGKTRKDVVSTPQLPPQTVADIEALMLRGDRLLKALRKWRDINQMDLSLKTGIGERYLSDIESSRKSGTPETIAKIAGALEVDLSWRTSTREGPWT